ncbi:MAG TPA: DUF5004 domain-containing protein [Bacteroidales bacterium]|nr:DUF5004 domain-containing protein [Bacteroidales bacterium]
MKKNSIIISFIIVALVFAACNKYEEGPTFSLLSVTKRITGTWELKETIINDTVVDLNDMIDMMGEAELDSLSDMGFDISQLDITAVKVTFEKDGDGNFYFAINMSGFPFSRTEYMTWEFDEDKENVEITIMSEIQIFEIIRLSNSELWLRRIEVQDGITTTTVMKLEKEKD